MRLNGGWDCDEPINWCEYDIKTTIAVRKLLTDDFIENIENLAGIKIDDKGFDMLDKFFLEFISKNKTK